MPGGRGILNALLGNAVHQRLRWGALRTEINEAREDDAGVEEYAHPSSRPAIAFFFDQRGDIDRWAVVGRHGRPRDTTAPQLSELPPPPYPLRPAPRVRRS